MISRRSIIAAAPALLLPRRLFAAKHGSILNDGAVGGSGGSPAAISAQHPTLLNGYVRRPPWRVAGVDYAVGYTSAPSLNPSAIPNIVIDNVNKTYTMGTPNQTIDGYDFTIPGSGGGVYSFSISAQNCIVRNCKFAFNGASSSSGGLMTQNGSNTDGLQVYQNVFDGGTVTAGVIPIVTFGSGSVLFQYNWLKNWPGSMSSFGGGASGGCQLTCQYNLIEEGGLVLPFHQNQLQWSSGNTGGQIISHSCIVQFNTVIQHMNQPQGHNTMFQFYDNANQSHPRSSSLDIPLVGYNTMIALHSSNLSPIARTAGMTYILGQQILAPANAPGNLPYFYCVGGTTLIASLNATEPNYATASDTSVFADGTANMSGYNNAVNAPFQGPNDVGFPTPISGSPLLHDNYMDLSGANGAWYEVGNPSFNGWAIANNINMNTGAVIPYP